MKKNRVIVEVRDGMVNRVVSDKDIDLIIVDWSDPFHFYENNIHILQSEQPEIGTVDEYVSKTNKLWDKYIEDQNEALK